MHVLTRSVPVPDDRDPSRSLREMYTYLFDLSEQIDYTLARQGIQLGKVSLPATQEQVEKLTHLTEQMNAAVTAASAQAAQAQTTAADMQAEVIALHEQVTDLNTRVEMMEYSIDPLRDELATLQEDIRVSLMEMEARLSALEEYVWSL